MGYYANAALEQAYPVYAYHGCPDRGETLLYYLEDLQAMLSARSEVERYEGSKGRYHYYELPWAEDIRAGDIYAAISEVEQLLPHEQYKCDSAVSVFPCVLRYLLPASVQSIM